SAPIFRLIPFNIILCQGEQPVLSAAEGQSNPRSKPKHHHFPQPQSQFQFSDQCSVGVANGWNLEFGAWCLEFGIWYLGVVPPKQKPQKPPPFLAGAMRSLWFRPFFFPLRPWNLVCSL